MVCSKCGKKIWKWKEKKIDDKIYCESCYNSVQYPSKTVNDDNKAIDDVLREHNQEPTPDIPEYTLTENDIEIGLSLIHI